MAAKLICPSCGWAGWRRELNRTEGCPACDYEPPATLGAMLRAPDKPYHEVRMDKFLPHVLAWAGMGKRAIKAKGGVS